MWAMTTLRLKHGEIFRVVKCHGFDGLSRVKMSACWGKKVVRTYNLAKSNFLWGKFTQL